MEDFLLVVLMIAVIVLFIRQRGRAAERNKVGVLTEHVENLERRLQTVERAAVQATPTPVKEPTPEQAPAWQPQTHLKPVQAEPPPMQRFVVPAPPVRADLPAPMPARPYIPSPPPPVPPAAPVAPKRSVSLEERLGQNWLNKLGIIAVVIGIALFLSRELVNLGPMGKSLIGVTLSLLILAFGIFLERKDNYRIFARAAIGGGWALTFFVTFALYHLPAMQVIKSQALDLVLMMVVATAMVAHSLRYKSQVVTALAFLLAFVTVGISEVTLFSLVAGALLAAGLVFVAARERWFELGLAGLVGAYLNHFLWLHRALPNGATPGRSFPEFVPSAALLLFYWLIFRLLYVFRVPESRQQELVSTLAAVLNSVGLLGLLKYQSSHPEWAFYGLLVLGAAELALAFVARSRHHRAFVVLTIVASALLLAAVPFKFSGSNWSLLWLLEAEMLFLAGIALREVVFRRLGLLAGAATAIQLFITGVGPIFEYRQLHPDAGHHLPVAIALVVAAILFWTNAEAAPRRFSFIAEPELDGVALTFTSYLAVVTAATGLWVFVPGAWTIVVWLGLTLALAFAADKLGSQRLAAQTDLLAIAAVMRAIAINLRLSVHGGVISTRAVTVTLAIAMLYMLMRRRTRVHPKAMDYIPASYSWAAAALVSLLLWYELQPASTTVAWAVVGLLLFELGLALRRNYFRQQGFALLVASFIRLYFVNLTLERGPHMLGPRLYTVLPLIAAYFWVYERLHAETVTEAKPSRFDSIASDVAAWIGTVALASLVYFEIRAPWICIAWAVLALIAMGLAWALKRSLFTAQAFVLLFAAALRALLFNLFAPTPLAVSITTGRLFTIGATSAVMLLALPLAFAIRRARVAEASVAADPRWKVLLLGRPEQMFFFAPLLLITAVLAVQLRAGMITIAWSGLGLVTFLFALIVGERSFRLAGLSLLMLCVGKIVCVDIWHATPTDRYITLIVLGIALLSVSFLYSRYREMILNLL